MMKGLAIITGIAAFVALAGMHSCSKDNVADFAGPGCTDTISFAAKIQPMINANCATSGCHDPGTQSSGYDFSTYENIAANATIMLQAMRWESGVTPMPLGGNQLPDSLIQQFSCWVNQGKKDN